MKHLVVNDNVKLVKEEKYIFVDQLMANKVLAYNKNINYCVIKNPWLNKERYQEAHDYIASFKKKVLSELVEQLNEIYKLKFDYNQWNILIGMWLTDILFLIYDHYTRITSIDERFNLVINKINIETNRSVAESISSMVCDDYFNAFIYSVICKELGIEIIYKEERDSTKVIKKLCYYMQSKYGRKKIADKLIKKKRKSKHDFNGAIIDKVKEGTEIVVIKGRFPNGLENAIKDEVGDRIVMFSDSDFENIESYIICDTQDEHPISINFDNLTFDNRFEEIAAKIVPCIIPEEFCVNNFINIYKKAENIIKQWNIKKIYSSAYIGIGFLASMCASLEYDKNVEVIDIQHSAGYNLNNSAIYNESLVFDKILTWGWKTGRKIYGCDIDSFSINRTILSENMSYDSKSDRILYATNQIESYEVGRGLICDNYEKRHFELIDELNEDEKKHLIVRLFTDDINSSIMHKYICEYKNIKLENVREIKFYDSLSRSKLLICDSYGSTHIESMILNHPVMFFNGIDMPIKNEQVEDLLDELKKVYIYADSPKELMDNYRKIDNIKQWWDSSIVQETVKRYLDVCANGYNKDLKKIWISEFLKENIN